MRIGELLQQRGWVGKEALASAIAAQSGTSLRLCSLLVTRGAITFDQASRALGEQLGCAALLHKHLEHRDRGVERQIPESFARTRHVLPIGHLGDGALIVCARDPSAELHAELARIVNASVVLAVAPAHPLEQQIAVAYPGAVDIELDIAIEAPVVVRRSRPLPSVRPTDAARDPLDVAIAALGDTDTIDWLLDVVFDYLAPRFRTAVLLEVRERRAVGVRGHQVAGVRTLVIDRDELDIDPLLAAAIKSAAPIVTPIGSTHVLVAGDPIDADREDAAVDLELLCEAIASAVVAIREREP